MLLDQLTKRSDILDVDDLKNRCLGNMTFVQQVLQLLADRAEADIVQLEQVAAQDDYEGSYHVAHRLKGAFANASAVRMSELAEELCTAARSQNQGHLREKVKALRAHWNEFVELTTGESPESFAPEESFEASSNTVSV